MKPTPGLLSCLKPLFLSGFLFIGLFPGAQMITGVWHGKMNGQKVELKVIQQGDSLFGTSYYYGSGNSFRRYAIKGYFDHDNTVVWWDDQLIENRNAGGKNALFAVADFNCPGGGEMRLDGKSSSTSQRANPKGSVALLKVDRPLFTDEWDYVIDNFTIGANDPYIIDSVRLIARTPVQKIPEAEPVITVVRTEVPVTPQPQPIIEQPKTIEEKFVIRKKVFTTEIPLAGDSLELRFFDNVQVDGDSITLFLNDKMIFTHIRLTEKAFVIKLPINALADTNELTMVAENLGAIPPNTAYMVAIVNGQYYNVNLSSTEETSGMIRLVKPKKEPSGN